VAKRPTTLKPYKTYRFTGQDPIVEKVRSVFDDAGMKRSAVSRDSGVASSTMASWFKRRTKRPQFASINAVLGALGKELTISNKK
jgi:transcriptional regulator with XRE-family HTH domain